MNNASQIIGCIFMNFCVFRRLLELVSSCFGKSDKFYIFSYVEIFETILDLIRRVQQCR